MKKTIFLLIFALLLSLFANTSCAKETEAYVGMSYDEFRELVPYGEEHLTYMTYILYFDQKGSAVVVDVDHKLKKIEEVAVLSDEKPSLRKFNKLSEDTTPIEAFELLGMPSARLGDSRYIRYETKSGEKVRMQWHLNEERTEIVLSWEVYEPNE